MELSVQRNEAVRECARLTEELARMTQQCRSRAQELASRAHQCRQTAEAHDGALAEIRRLTAANEALQEAKDASETEFEFRRCLQVEREAVAAQQAQQAQRVLQLELQPPTDATVVTARLLQQLEVAEGKLKHAQAREQALEALLQQRQAIEEDALESNSERTGKHAEHSFGEIRAGPIAVARGMSDTALVSTVSIVFALTLVHLVHRLVIRRN
jgi:mannose-6-phosphate isomerase class I